MYANGFFEEQRRSPASLATVIGLHAAAFGALILFGTTTFTREPYLGQPSVSSQQPSPAEGSAGLPPSP